MYMFLIANIITCAGALSGFVYGAFRFFRPKAAAYPQMITLDSDVVAMGRLYQIIRILTIDNAGSAPEPFHLGVLATIGSLLFLFAANLGAMDSLVDDGSPELKKYRLIPFAAPLIIVAVYLAAFLFADPLASPAARHKGFVDQTGTGGLWDFIVLMCKMTNKIL